jgi:cob(I)alamin adenosyltransferase
MLFGGKGKSKAEGVEPGELYALLNSSFEGKLGPFRKKAEGIGRELRRAGEQFIGACDGFAELDAEPYTEDLYSVNVNYIRGQKDLYAETLKRLAKGLLPEPARAANAYEEYLAVVSRSEGAAAEILKANAQFRLVVHCYSNHLRDFKRAFSSVERLNGLLRAELERREAEFSEYRTVRESISRFESRGMELDEVRKEAGELERGLRPDDAGALDMGQRDILDKLALKRKELARATAEGSDLHSRIGLLTAPLERPSRKFDHLSARKRQLHQFVDDPIGMMAGEAEYAEFRTLVLKLIDAVTSGAIEVKNREETVRTATAVLGADILSMIESFRSMQRRRSDLEGEIRGLERTLNTLNEGRTASESAAHRLESLKREAAELEKARDAERRAIEKLFSESYGKSISIKE